MTKNAFGRTQRLIVLGTVTGIAVGAIPAVAATADQSTEAKTPKNVIVLISDGAGYNQFDAARLFSTGQSYAQVAVNPATGAVTRVPGTPSEVYDDYPVQIAQKHSSATTIGAGFAYDPDLAWRDFDWVKNSPTDSAAAATALGTGVKTRNGVIGQTPDNAQLLTVGEQAKAVGKKVGVVTTVPFNHATPAGFIAHNPNRNDYFGLATEMIDSGIDVIIGGGHPAYDENGQPRTPVFQNGKTWISEADFARVSSDGTPFEYIETAQEFASVAAGVDVPEKLFGLAKVAETFQYSRAGLGNANVLPYTDPAVADVPSLPTAAQAALNVLGQDEDGFFLMIEGGAVDWAGHANQTTRVVEEQLDFNAAVRAVDAWVEANSTWDETLVIVTADHETGYLAGPNAGGAAGWTALTGVQGALPAVSWHSGSHTNALVPFFAKGAGSEVLAARATGWDTVRGAYLDNTDVGEAVFDFLGHAAATGDAVGVEASIALPAESGALSLGLPTLTSPVVFAGDAQRQTAALPEIVVTDARNEAQARGKGWTLAGSASAFVAGNREFGAEHLSWTPKVVASESGAAAGAVATLQAPATLADADRVTRRGSTTVAADLALEIPESAKAGRYGSEITLTLFAKD